MPVHDGLPAPGHDEPEGGHMPLYESVFIARQDVSAAQVEAIGQKIQGIIAEQGGKVTKNEYWGLKNLAYRIKKNRKGHYTLLNVDAPPAAIKEMERNLRIDEDVLRYLTVRVEELEEGPSAMLRSREDRGRRFGDRDERGDRGDRGDRGPRGGWRDRDFGPREGSAREGSARDDRPPRRSRVDAPAEGEAP
jgi:small subunit ribosomal protein S6